MPTRAYADGIGYKYVRLLFVGILTCRSKPTRECKHVNASLPGHIHVEVSQMSVELLSDVYHCTDVILSQHSATRDTHGLRTCAYKARLHHDACRNTKLYVEQIHKRACRHITWTDFRIHRTCPFRAWWQSGQNTICGEIIPGMHAQLLTCTALYTTVQWNRRKRCRIHRKRACALQRIGWAIDI
jgi:hypothetical protein